MTAEAQSMPKKSGGGPPKRRLRNYLLDPGFQLKYTGAVVLVTVLVTSGVGAWLGYEAYKYSTGMSDMLLMQDETFGPLLPVIAFTSDEEALALANDSEFGLSGSVFGEEAHALRVAEGLNVGAVGINDASMTALIHDVEKQSFKESGLGPSHMGDAGLLRFLRQRALLIQGDRPAGMAVFDESLMP